MSRHTSYSAVLLALLLLLSSCAEPRYKEDSIVLGGQGRTAGTVPAASPADIALAPGDTVAVSVWGQNDLSKNVTLDAAGYIHFPLAGKIKATGLSAEQLAVQLTTQLRRYYTEPLVTVMPTELAGQNYYVLGEVGKPGKFIIRTQAAVVEAVAEAGGPGKDAADMVILLRRQGDRLFLYSIPLAYRGVGEHQLDSMTMVLQPRDILYVPPSHIADVERFMQRLSTIMSPLLELERGILYWPELVRALEGTSSDVLVR